ncbi:hypothetical protein [Bacteroides sp. 224]|uniref:hypothetical protein n=1 Tax=Bacteroides sp. 224 TaxID=2302936 RepID=UPI0013D52B45|nr:hypothetical protein [Bacteroides sp. 224]NDV64574.1 hypothetical protein [Bacteroides sp. 224]
MKKIFILLFVITCTVLPAVSQNLAKMSEQKRSRFLLKTAKETILKYGPGYYRDYVPSVDRFYIGERRRGGQAFSAAFEEKHNGRFFYRVKYPYDKTKEYFRMDYSACVFIWEDTGKPFHVSFGYGIFLELEELPTTRSGEHPVIEYKQSTRYKIVNIEEDYYDEEGKKGRRIRQVLEVDK